MIDPTNVRYVGDPSRLPAKMRMILALALLPWLLAAIAWLVFA